MKIIFLRLDKIGDLIATLPVDQLPGLASFSTSKTGSTSVVSSEPVEIKWVIAKNLGWLAKAAVPPRQFMELDLRTPKESEAQLLAFLKAEKPDAVVVFYAPWWVGRACWRARVPLRIGRRSQWHSYLFFNKGLRQSRSQAEKHEADYNRELVEYGFGLSPAETPLLKLEPTILRRLFDKYSLRSHQYYVVHPGMAGSALNWPQEKYNELIRTLVDKNETVVITGTAGDDKFLDQIRPRWISHRNVRYLQNQLSFEELLSLLATAKAVVAPSTGVLHLAAAMGTPSVGIYSPVRVHRARRWGPRGTRATALTPAVTCPADQQCLGSECQHFPCMQTITANEVLAKLEAL
jgi:ADP-heptose:LPS heptosyltransferase